MRSVDPEVRADLVSIVDPAVSDEEIALGGTNQGLAVEIVLGKDGMKPAAERGIAKLTAVVPVGPERTERGKHGLASRRSCSMLKRNVTGDSGQRWSGFKLDKWES